MKRIYIKPRHLIEDIHVGTHVVWEGTMSCLCKTWQNVNYICSDGMYRILNTETPSSRYWYIHPNWCYSEDEIEQLKQKQKYLRRTYEDSSINTNSTLEWSV